MLAPTDKPGGWAKHVFYDTGVTSGASGTTGPMIAFWELHDDRMVGLDTALSTGLGYEPWVNHIAFAASSVDTGPIAVTVRVGPRANSGVLIAGGTTTSTGAPLASGAMYDPAAGTFGGVGSLTTPRALHSASLLPSREVLLAGGRTADFEALGSAERFDPAGRSPDPACDAVHAQSKQSGYTSGQIRLAVVRTALTEKAASSGVQLDAPIDVATRELVDVTGVRPERGGAAIVTYTWRWTPTNMAGVMGYRPPAPQQATARLRRSDAGWVADDAGVK